MVLATPEYGANFNMFFIQVPGAGLQWYLLVISTIATVLASQVPVVASLACVTAWLQ